LDPPRCLLVVSHIILLSGLGGFTLLLDEEGVLGLTPLEHQVLGHANGDLQGITVDIQQHVSTVEVHWMVDVEHTTVTEGDAVLTEPHPLEVGDGERGGLRSWGHMNSEGRVA
jgi:hypothetical protein